MSECHQYLALKGLGNVVPNNVERQNKSVFFIDNICTQNADCPGLVIWTIKIDIIRIISEVQYQFFWFISQPESILILCFPLPSFSILYIESGSCTLIIRIFYGKFGLSLYLIAIFVLYMLRTWMDIVTFCTRSIQIITQ